MISWLAGLRVARSAEPGGSFDVALAFGVGAIAATLSATLWLVLGKPGLFALAGIEAGALAVGLALPPSADATALRLRDAPRLAWAVLAAALAAVLIGVVVVSVEFPYGSWIALDIWNERARSLVRADLASAIAANVKHPDYPLLLPTQVALLWTWLGERRAIPLGLTLGFSIATFGALWRAIPRRAEPAAAALLLAALVASPLFAVSAASQAAEAPLAFYMLASLALLARALDRPATAALPLAGLLLAGAAWTKNEGIAFAVVAGSLFIALGGPDARRRAWQIACGGAPLWLALVHHKLTAGATTDLIALQHGGLSARLTDPARWLEITRAFAPYLAAIAALGGALFAGLRARAAVSGRGARLVAAVVCAMVGVYFATYLATPRDLTWHLESSLDRLMQGLWPLVLLGIALRLPERTRGGHPDGDEADDARPAG